MKEDRRFLLPFGIDITVENGVANIESDLTKVLPRMSDPVEIGRLISVVEGVEQLLLSLARAGVDLSKPQFAEALQNCVANLQ